MGMRLNNMRTSAVDMSISHEYTFKNRFERGKLGIRMIKWLVHKILCWFVIHVRQVIDEGLKWFSKCEWGVVATTYIKYSWQMPAQISVCSQDNLRYEMVWQMVWNPCYCLLAWYLCHFNHLQPTISFVPYTYFFASLGQCFSYFFACQLYISLPASSIFLCFPMLMF